MRPVAVKCLELMNFRNICELYNDLLDYILLLQMRRYWKQMKLQCIQKVFDSLSVFELGLNAQLDLILSEYNLCRTYSIGKNSIYHLQNYSGHGSLKKPLKAAYNLKSSWLSL